MIGTLPASLPQPARGMFTHYTGNRQFDLQLNRTFASLLDHENIARIADTALAFARRDITSLRPLPAQRF